VSNQPSPDALSVLQTPDVSPGGATGDLHSTAAHSDVYRPDSYIQHLEYTPWRRALLLAKEDAWDGTATRISGMISIFETSNLRTQIDCLLQPPLSGSDSVEASPRFLQLTVAAHKWTSILRLVTFNFGSA